MYKAFDFCGDFVALFAQSGKLLSQPRYDKGGSLSTGYHNGLLGEGLSDVGSESFAHGEVRA